MKYEIGDMILYNFEQADNNHTEFIAHIVNIDEYSMFVNDAYSSSGQSITNGFEISLEENRYSDSKIIKNFGKLTLEEIKEQFPEYFI